MHFVYRIRAMPGQVRIQTFIRDLQQLVGARCFQMLPEVPDNLFVLLIQFDDHAEKASSDLPEGCCKNSLDEYFIRQASLAEPPSTRMPEKVRFSGGNSGSSTRSSSIDTAASVILRTGCRTVVKS